MKVYVVLYKDEIYNFHNSTEWVVDRVFDSYEKVLGYSNQYCKKYWERCFLVVEKDLY